VRGDRDLPVLIVTGPDLAAAIAALASDLAGGTIEAELAPGGASPDPPLAGHCMALLNRGTPSSLVSADGTLHIGLLRASSAGPARREDGVTVRLRDAGRGPGPGAAGTAARVRLFTAPGTARLTSLLEDADGSPLLLVDGAAEAVVPTAGTVTLALAGFGAGPEAGGPADSGRARPGNAPPEPAQPVFSRYWL